MKLLDLRSLSFDDIILRQKNDSTVKLIRFEPLFVCVQITL